MPQQQRRNRVIIGVLSLGLLVGGLTAGPAQAVDAVGPYYAEPAWDQKMIVVNRFVVLTNWNSQAVLDKETGLVWERSPAADPKTWSAARTACMGRTTGNRRGWRLPSIHELASLVLPSVAPPGPTLPPGHPFLSARSSFYWSATTDADDPAFAWGVHFNDSNVYNNVKSDNGIYTWCVRGGMNADAY